MHRPALRLLLPLLATACAGTQGGTPDEPQRAEPEGHSPGPAMNPEAAAGEDVAAVVALLESGHKEEAHAALEHLLLADYLATARALFGEDNPQDGLLWVDRALELDEDDPEALLARAEGNLALAEDMIRRGSGGVYVEGAFQDALTSFESLVDGEGSDPRALLGASRAAFMLGRADEALRFARAGVAAVEAGAPAPAVAPERTLVDAAFLAYRTARGAEAAPEEVARLFDETEGALTTLLGSDAADPWAWTMLASLYEWEARWDDAQRTVLGGLQRAPEDAGLFAALQRVARQRGGGEAVVEALDAFLTNHPENALGHFTVGRERYVLAVSEYSAGAQPVSAFATAEDAFARSRELDPAFTESALGFEIMCRAGRAWSYMNGDELEPALEAFLSMNELAERGLEWEDEGYLASGIRGLFTIGDRYAQEENFAGAARLFGLLHENQPEEVAWANNTGFFSREAATTAEGLGKRLCELAGGGAGSERMRAELLDQVGIDASAYPDEAALAKALRAKANELMQAARDHMDVSCAAYKDAAALAPEDVRVVNDTALVFIYHARRELEYAEELLHRCTRLGKEQLETRELTEEERFDLTEAWGDAYQNLGVLYQFHKGDPQGAIPYYEKSVATGIPVNFERPLVERLLQMARRPEQFEDILGILDWAEPCS